MLLSKSRHPVHTHLDSETFFQVSHKVAFYLPKTRYNKAKCNANVRAKCSPMPCQPHSCLQASTQTLSGHHKHCSSIQWEALESNSLVFFSSSRFSEAKSADNGAKHNYYSFPLQYSGDEACLNLKFYGQNT